MCVDGDIKPYSLIHSLTVNSGKQLGWCMYVSTCMCACVKCIGVYQQVG